MTSRERRRSFVPLAMGKDCPEARTRNGKSENRSEFTSRIPKAQQSPGNLGETKVLPLIAALIVILAALGMGLFDSFFLGAKRPKPGSNPNKLEASIQEVNRSSITVSKPKISSSKMVFTRHEVGRGETISRIAYHYGLSPVTIVSVNELNIGEIPEEGRSLMIPYIDGRRVQHLGNEGIREVAARFNTAIDRVRQIPGSEDYFIYGRIPDEASPSNTIGERFLYPVPGRISTAYGESVDDITGISYISEGIGISAKSGTPVNSSKEGRVILTGHHSIYGLYVIMSHAKKWKSFYGYLGSIEVAVGDKLDAGEPLGYSGASGAARSPQVLFVLISAGESVDPLDYLY